MSIFEANFSQLKNLGKNACKRNKCKNGPGWVQCHVQVGNDSHIHLHTKSHQQSRGGVMHLKCGLRVEPIQGRDAVKSLTGRELPNEPAVTRTVAGTTQYCKVHVMCITEVVLTSKRPQKPNPNPYKKSTPKLHILAYSALCEIKANTRCQTCWLPHR